MNLFFILEGLLLIQIVDVTQHKTILDHFPFYVSFFAKLSTGYMNFVSFTRMQIKIPPEITEVYVIE